MANVSKTQLKERLAGTFKTKAENVSVFGLHTKFGGGRSTGFACVYNSSDERKKYDSVRSLRREKIVTKTTRARKAKKEIKGRVKKVRGIAKTKAAQSAGGKKK